MLHPAAFIVPYIALVAIASLPVNIFPDKLVPNVPDNMPRNPPFCSFFFIFNCFANNFYQ